MLKKYIINLLFAFAVTLNCLFFAYPVLAANQSLGGLDSTAGSAGYKTGNNMQSNRVPEIVGIFINSALSLLGVVFMSLVLWGAFDIIGAGGNEEVVKSARNRIKNGAVGILIILAAFFITKAFMDFVSQGVFNLGSSS